MPVKKKKTFIRRTTEKKGSNNKPNTNEKEVVTEEIETTEQVDPDEKINEIEETKEESKDLENAESDNETVSSDKSDLESNLVQEEVPANDIQDEAPSRLEQIAEEQAEELESNSSRSSFLWGVIPVILIAGIIIGGIYVYNLGVKKGKQQSLDAIQTIEPSKKISPTEAPAALDEFSIEVLNGSGIGGEAGKVSDQLTNAGFDVLSTGNADSSDYEKTVIKVKEKVREVFVKKLMDELENTYELDKTEILDDSESADVIVIVGSSKVE